MVFCDCCNICVHQACYGITSIPDGSWLCRTCSLSQRPDCVLCPNKGGAMKCTRSGQKWAHVSCALWIPEVSIGCVERMEPITKISSIPVNNLLIIDIYLSCHYSKSNQFFEIFINCIFYIMFFFLQFKYFKFRFFYYDSGHKFEIECNNELQQSRWALICVLCRERVGACIQCSIKTCKTAYHVTCAFKYGLEMKAIIEDEMADDGVKLRVSFITRSKFNH